MYQWCPRDMKLDVLDAQLAFQQTQVLCNFDKKWESYGNLIFYRVWGGEKCKGILVFDLFLL